MQELAILLTETQVRFAITFSFIDSTHVKVFLDGVSTTNFTVSGSNVVMNSNPANSNCCIN